MKQSLKPMANLGFLLMIFTSALAPSLCTPLPPQGREEDKLSDAIPKDSTATLMEQIEFFNEMIGGEICDDGDEGCLRRRMVAEAHLDYIYTQSHKP